MNISKKLKLCLILLAIISCNNNELSKHNNKDNLKRALSKTDKINTSKIETNTNIKELSSLPTKRIEASSKNNPETLLPTTKKEESSNIDSSNLSSSGDSHQEKLLTPFDYLENMVKKARQKLKEESEEFDSSEIETDIPFDKIQDAFIKTKKGKQHIYASLGYNIQLINKLGKILDSGYLQIKKEKNYTYHDYTLVQKLFKILYGVTSNIDLIVNTYLKENNLNTINKKAHIEETNLITLMLNQILEERNNLIPKIINSMSILFDEMKISNNTTEVENYDINTRQKIYSKIKDEHVKTITDIVQNKEINQSFNDIEELRENIGNLLKDIAKK
ncbi:hypothetical protein F9Y90_04720 (plasmid) [Borrelia miyamotoi]|uniref:Uncharacterized protein n=1 Tax=Borrelia miyamotoi TaxID=47466 RepID=A0A5P8AUI2_9SPIR|nr:hypothetical protein [Borrelia miyamotoi]QFP42421.1 hypothetical protein F9Y90_04720 [Borrelia miyamotoi]WAZ72423.1 hypothetical protein O5404_05210 [Borrelia miyamotoi]WVI05344.1 hypothetical protein F9Y91_00565 [Borrelia miyamotoi]